MSTPPSILRSAAPCWLRAAMCRAGQSLVFPVLVLLAFAGSASGQTSAQPVPPADPKPTPAGIAVFPIADLRRPGRSDWLGEYLRIGIDDTLRRTGRFPVLGESASKVWAARLGRAPGRAISSARLSETSAGLLVRGTTQRVVDQAVVEIELLRAVAGAEAASTRWKLALDLSRDTPAEGLRRVAAPLLEVLAPGTSPDLPTQPESWPATQAFYEIVSGGDAMDAAERDTRLAQAQRDPALRPKALAFLAEAKLEQALVDTSDETRRAPILRAALRMATEAGRLEPWHSEHLALKAELHFFLKEDYEARTEASVARLRNPLDGLAYAVLALVAGLSTGEGAEWMKKALAADPYLRASARPPGWPPFQRGAIEPLMARWDKLTKTPDRWSDPEFEHQLTLGKQLFEQGRFDEAESAFQAADGMGMDNPQPRLYLARIRQEGGDVQGAANDLRTLAGEFPQESEVWLMLGLALEKQEAFDDAVQAFRRALDEDDAAPQTLYHMALSQVGQEDLEGAQGTLAQLLQRNTRHQQGWLLLGAVETRLERWREALRAYEQVLQLDPNSEKARAGIRLSQSKLISR